MSPAWGQPRLEDSQRGSARLIYTRLAATAMTEAVAARVPAYAASAAGLTIARLKTIPHSLQLVANCQICCGLAWSGFAGPNKARFFGSDREQSLRRALAGPVTR
jgi:hypothetical protein